MCKRVICLLSLVLVLGLTLASSADASLVGWWPFDEGSGTTAIDSSGNGNDGTLNGGAQWVAGQLGGAIEFNGSNSYVAAPHIPFDSRSFTIAMWINPVLYTDQQVIFGQVQSGSLNLSMHFRLGGPGGSAPAPGAVRMGFYSNDLNTAGGLIQDNNWYHLTFWYDFPNQTRRIYIDAVQQAEDNGAPYLGASGETRIGQWNNNQWFQGMIDDVQIYDHPLSQAEIETAMDGLGGFPLASRPNPEDGATHADTWVSLSWRPGDFAVSHDVYFGESFDDVNNGTGDTFRGNQASAFYVAGFPGFAYPDGLVPGATYYWRIDEVNDAEPNSPWRGPVWSFWVPPKKAYDPTPFDGANFVPVDIVLSWTGGFGTKLHTVYFGDDFDTVANAAGGIPQALTQYDPGPLEFNKTYHWRVDQFDSVTTLKGDVWTFTTTRPGLGSAIMDRWENITGTTLDMLKNSPKYPNNPDVTETVDQFAWDGPDTDNYGARIEAWLYAPATGDYTFWLNTDDNGELWLSTDDDSSNIRLIAQESSYTGLNSWGTGEEQSAPIPLVGGEKYYIMALWKEGTGGDHCQVAWRGPGVPVRTIIPGTNLSPFEPMSAYGAKPGNKAAGVTQTPILQWKPGLAAASHEVYFGTDEDAVRNATKASPEYKGSKQLGDESYDPGKLAWETTYYWRVDEINTGNAGSPWVGSVWSFTTADFLIVDDFEGYTDDDAAGEAIWQNWIDGFGVPANGSQVGYVLPPYAEQTVVHGGRQSMPLLYNNTAGVTVSEAELALTNARDWTEGGVENLSIWFHGQPGSTGDFVEAPASTYTMRGSGADIWNTADEFHFAYKTLTGAGSIVARVVSVQNTNAWAKAGVMIRETLEPGSKHALGCVTPGNGVSSQGREIADTACYYTNQTGITAPYWVKLERDLSGNFTVYHSANGTSWQPVTGAVPTNIQMGSTVYVGLAVTSHDAALTTEAVFSNVTTTGTVSPQWSHQDIGIASNAAEPLYVTVSNSTGQPAVVVHDDPAAALINAWTQWVIPLSAFSDQGINLTNVGKIALGLGAKGGAASAGGSGTVYFDDIRITRPAPAPAPQP